jgi:hypothetical protein
MKFQEVLKLIYNKNLSDEQKYLLKYLFGNLHSRINQVKVKKLSSSIVKELNLKKGKLLIAKAVRDEVKLCVMYKENAHNDKLLETCALDTNINKCYYVSVWNVTEIK